MKHFKSLTALLLIVFVCCISGTMAQTGDVRELRIEKNRDFYGFDFATLKKVSLETCKSSCLSNDRCRAFTYNVKARFCFLKSDFAKNVAFDGAISGKVITRSAEQDMGAAPKLDYLYGSWRHQAQKLKKDLTKRAGEAAQLGHSAHASMGIEAAGRDNYAQALHHLSLALALDAKDSVSWSALSLTAANQAQRENDRNKARKAREQALAAALQGYETSRYRSTRATALSRLGQALELSGWYREALNAYRQSLDLKENPSDRAAYARLRKAHGFRMLNHSINSDAASPRVCVNFSDDLKKGFGDFSSYFRVNQQPPKALDISRRQICVEGLAHGQSYQIDIREGLPAENGEALLSNVNLDLYVRDRAASMRFSGNHYILPASGRRGLPLVSINSNKAKLNLYRVGERSVVSLLRQSRLLAQLEDWQISDLVSSLGEPVWKGTLSIEPERNREVTTSIPIDEALPTRKPGIYLMTASPAAHGLKDFPSVASQWFVISDIGLVSFSGQSNGKTAGLQVFARSLRSAEPLQGLNMTLVARNNEVLAKATSDATGLAAFDAGLLRGSEGLAPAMVTATGPDGDFVFLDLTRPGFDLSDRGVTGRESPQGVDLYAWTERGIYRPGELVHVATLARNGKAEAIKGLPLTFIVRRPDGMEAQRLVDNGKALGGYAVNLHLTSNAMHGVWRISIHTDPKKPALSEQMFLVEDFLPDRTAFSLTADRQSVARGQLATASVEGRYLYGAPAAGLSLEGEVLVRERRERKGFKDFIFGLDEAESAGIQRIEIDSPAPLDDQGRGQVSFALNHLKSTTRPLVADLVVRMREGSGRPVERRTRLAVAPRGNMIGIRPQFDDKQVSENSNVDFSLVAVGPDGHQTAMSFVRWSLIKIERHYQWYKDGNRWRYEAVDLETQIADGSTDLSADEFSKLSLPVDWGHYRLAVEGADEETGIATSSFDFHAGWQVAAGSIDTPDGLELALDKASYKMGDTARLKISPRFAGRMLLAIGSDHIIETRSVDVPAEGTEINLDVTEEWGTGVYLLANLYRPSDKAPKSGINRNPARAIGVEWLKIDPADRALTVTMTIDETNLPKEQLIVPIKVEGVRIGEEAYVTVALVDEGILNLTSYKAPDLVGRYFGQRKLGIDIRDLYGRLIDGSLGASGTLRTGGDGGGPNLKAKGDRTTQELVAFFSGIVRLDDAGEAEVAFDIPQFSGSARLMATAWTGKAVGNGVSDTFIRAPVVIQTSQPRFLAPGDMSRILVEMTNKDAPEGPYEMTVETGKELKITTISPSSMIELAKDKKISLTLPIKAVSEGDGWVRIKLASKAEGSDLVLDHEQSLQVRHGALPVTRIERVSLPPENGKLEVSSDLLAGYRPDGAQLSVSVGKTGFYDLPSILMQLNRYPYGCAEQVTSKALPLLYARDLAYGLPQDLASLSGKEIKARLGQAISKLLSYQSSSGGFSLWGGGVDDPWLSAYVTDFLTRARETGFDVPSEPFKLALQALRNRLAYNTDINKDPDSLAYGLYVLARNKMASAGDLRYYADTKLGSFDSPLSRAHLGSALALYGDNNRADMAFSSALTLARSTLNSTSFSNHNNFGSAQRDLAAMMALGSEISLSPSNLGTIRQLALSLYDPTMPTSTQEQAWMLLSARTDKLANQAVSLDVNGYPHAGAFARDFDTQGLAAPITITNKSNEPLEARLTTIATPERPLPAGGNGLVLSRSYHRLDGSPTSISEVAQNERFVVVLTGRMEQDLSSRLILSDLLPAGLEIENPRLLTSADNQNFNWIKPSKAAHVAFRHDRMLAAFDKRQGDDPDFAVAYTVRAVTPGHYLHPAAVVEDMYRPQFSARTASGWMIVKGAGQ